VVYLELKKKEQRRYCVVEGGSADQSLFAIPFTHPLTVSPSPIINPHLSSLSRLFDGLTKELRLLVLTVYGF